MTDNVDVNELARELRAATAYLELNVTTRAHHLAQVQIAAAEAIYEGRAAAIEEAWALDRQRKDDLLAEMRRQLKAADKSRSRMFEENKDLRNRVGQLEEPEFDRRRTDGPWKK